MPWYHPALAPSLINERDETIKKLRAALNEIVGISGLDDPLIKGANPVVFERVGRIHQIAGAALALAPGLPQP